MDERLVKKFDDAMFREVYQRAIDVCGYRATYFLNMLASDGGMATALSLIRAKKESEGFTALWEKGHLELTVEALVWRQPWRSLFSNDDLQRAKNRVAKYGFKVSEKE